LPLTEIAPNVIVVASLVGIASGAAGAWAGVKGTLRVVESRLQRAEDDGKERNGKIAKLQEHNFNVMVKHDCEAIRTRCQSELKEDIRRVEYIVNELRKDMKEEIKAASLDRRETWQALMEMASPDTRARIIRERRNRETYDSLDES
jgi:uncharacterized protein (DUF305 family)